MMLRFILLISFLLVHAVYCLAEKPPQSDALATGKAELILVEVPDPDLSVLEDSVARQLKKARETLDKAIADRTGKRMDLIVAYGELGRIYHAYELYEPAEACYQNVRKIDPKSFTAAYLLGYLYQGGGRLKQAVEPYRAAVSLNPKYMAAWIRLGDVYRGLDQPKEAQSTYREAQKLAPEDPAVLARLGDSAMAARQYRKAVDYFTSALNKQPEANRLHYSVAMAWRALGDAAKAREHLAKSGKIGIRPADPEVEGLAGLIQGERVQLLRGKLAYSVGRYEEAAEAFRAAVQADPKSVRARINLSVCLLHLGQRNEAKVQLQEALKLNPKSLTAHYNLGLSAGYDADYRTAVEHLTEAVKLRPDDAEIHIALADALRMSGQHAQALKHYAKAVKLDPGWSRGWLGQARLMLEEGRYAGTLRVLNKAQSHLPKDGSIAHVLAQLLAGCPDLSLRDGKRALELAQAVYQAWPTVTHAETLAMAFAETGECKKAAEVQQSALNKLEQGGFKDRAAELAKTLNHYKNERPCRYPTTK